MFGKIWQFLKGKKTTIGAIVTVITKGLVATGQITPETGALIENVGVGVILVGLGDKAAGQVAKLRAEEN